MAELVIGALGVATTAVMPLASYASAYIRSSHYKHAVRARSKEVRRVVRKLVTKKEDLKGGYKLQDADTEAYDSRIILEALRHGWDASRTVSESVARRFHDVKCAREQSGKREYLPGSFEALVEEAAQIEVGELSISRLRLAGLFLDNCRERREQLVDVLRQVRDGLRLTAADRYGSDLFAGQSNFTKHTFVARLSECRTLNESVIEAMLQDLNGGRVTNDFICKQGQVIELAWDLEMYDKLYVGCDEGNLVIYHGAMERDDDGVVETAKKRLLSALDALEVNEILGHYLPACVMRDVVIGRHCDSQFLSCLYARQSDLSTEPGMRKQSDLLDLVRAASMTERRIESIASRFDFHGVNNTGITTNSEDYDRVYGACPDKPVDGIPEIDDLLQDIGRNTDNSGPYNGLREVYADVDDYHRLSNISTSAFQRMVADWNRRGKCEYDGSIRIDDDVLTSLTGNKAEDSYLLRNWHRKESYVVKIQEGYLVVEPCRRVVYVVRNDNPDDLKLRCTTSQRVESVRSQKALCAVACLATSVTPDADGGLRLASVREIRDRYRRGFYNAGYDLNDKVKAMMYSEMDLWENSMIKASAVLRCSEVVSKGLTKEDRAWVVREAIAQLSRRASIVECVDRLEGCFRTCVEDLDFEVGHTFEYDKRVPATGLMTETFLEEGREVTKLRSRGVNELVLEGPGPIVHITTRRRNSHQTRSIVRSDVIDTGKLTDGAIRDGAYSLIA